MHYSLHKASNRRSAIKSHGKDVVHFIFFLYFVGYKVPNPEAHPTHPKHEHVTGIAEV